MRKYLILLRKQQGQSPEEVARAIGISPEYYCLIEREECQKRMDISLAARLAEHFGIPVAQLAANEKAPLRGCMHYSTGGVR